MGVLSELIIADRSEAQAVAAAESPTQTWQGFGWKVLDPVNCGSLWAILEGVDLDVDGVVDRAGKFDLLAGSTENSPWVHLVPIELRDLLADLAATEMETV